MPAIPVYARLEMFLTDQELKDLHELTVQLMKDHSVSMNIMKENIPIRLDGMKHITLRLFDATTRVLHERNLKA